MSTQGLQYSNLFVKGLPPAASPWGGHIPFNFIGGNADPDLQPVEGFIESASRVFRDEGRSLATYNTNSGPLGYLPLRKFLVEKLARHRGINVSTDEVLITSGSGQAINLINNILLEPKDTVITELYSYAGVLSNLRQRKVNIVGIDTDDGGMIMDQLSSTLSNLRNKGVAPKYIYTIPTLQNPTGTVMGMNRRREMLRLSQEFGVPIFEDECYSDLIFEGEWEHAIRSLDQSNHVLHIGSFSKSLSPAIRLGYVVAPWEVLSQMLACKGDGGTGSMEQMIVGDYFQNNYEEHMGVLRSGLQRKLNVLIASLKEHFGPSVEFEPPRGGMFLWIKFPEGVDSRKLVEPALQAGIAFNPGPDWCAEPERAANYIRLCYAFPSDDTIREGVGKLAQVFHREAGVP